MVRIVIFIIKWIISRYLETLLSELVTRGYVIQHKEASAPPAGYTRVSSYLRRKKEKPE